jgi:hypothetical protein
MKNSEKVMNQLKKEFVIIEEIPSEIGRYNSRPIFIRDIELKKENIHTSRREINGIEYLVRQYSPSYRQKDTKGYFYFVYWNILRPSKGQ